MRTEFSPLFILFSICLLCSAALAQADQTKARQQAALDSLGQLRDSLQDVEDGCVKTHAQMQLADLLWTHDEAQARQLFEDAFNMAFRAEAVAGRKQCRAQSRVVSGIEALSRIARRDAALAAQLVESLPDGSASSELKGEARGQDIKARLQQSLAARQMEANSEKRKGSNQQGRFRERPINPRLLSWRGGGGTANESKHRHACALKPAELRCLAKEFC